MQEARFVIDDLAPNRNYDHRLMGYNNDPRTSFADIQKVLERLQARIEKRLAEDPAQDAMNELKIIRRVREILNSPAKWNRADTQDCAAGAKTFSLYCAFKQAGKDVTGHVDSSGAAIQAARRFISDQAPNRSQYQSRLTGFNNDPATTFADIQNLLNVVEQQLLKSSQR